MSKSRGTGHRGFSGRTIGRMISKPPSKTTQPKQVKGKKK